MKIIYLSNSRFPSERANSVHVAHMSAAFSKWLGEQNFCLLGIKGKTSDSVNAFSSYDTDHFRYRLFSVFKQKGGLLIYAISCILHIIWYRPRIVYSRFLLGAYLTTLIRVKLVFEFHSDEWNVAGLRGWLARKVLEARRLLAVVVISQALADQLAKDYPALQAPVKVEHDSAAPVKTKTSTTTSEQVLQGAKGKFNVGYTGSLQEGKGVSLILAIAERLEIADGIQFHIIGGDERQVVTLREADQSGLIYFYGYRPKREVAGFIRAFDCCVLPNQAVIKTGTKTSNIAAFTSPLKMFEYMAGQKPIVCSDMPVLREVLSEKMALFAPFDAPAEWQAALLKLKEDPQLAATISQCAYEYWQENFTWEQRASRIVQFIQSLLKDA